MCVIWASFFESPFCHFFGVLGACVHLSESSNACVNISGVNITCVILTDDVYATAYRLVNGMGDKGWEGTDLTTKLKKHIATLEAERADGK